MEPSTSTSSKGSYGFDPPADSSSPTLTPRTCALCGKSVKAGQRFLTLSIEEGIESRKPQAERSSKEKKSTGAGKLAREATGTRRVYGQARSRMPTSAMCHLKCLHCVECGYPLSGPPPGAPNDDRGLLFDKGGATAAYKKNVGSSGSRAVSGNIVGVGMGSSEEGRERWVADILKNFVAHAKCAEHLCAVCGEAISPGEQQVTLPHSSKSASGKDNDVGGPYSRMGSRPVSSRSGSLQSTLNSSKGGRKKPVYQHMRCTCCATCGFPLETHSSKESKGRIMSILLDDSGRPHHASCMACCCCRQPLFGGYEVHSFFGYLKMCQRALGEDPPLLPLPEGRAAALFGSVKNRDKAQLRKNNRPTGSTQNRSPNQLQDIVTPNFGGLCCAWCQSRVPCCVSCERRCAVYTDANGHQFLPRALTSKAQRAAELAAAISLGQVLPPSQPVGLEGAVAPGTSATSSKSERSRGSASDTLRQMLFSGTGSKRSMASNEAADGVNLTSRSGLSRTQSGHTLKTADTQGVLCGQCASLSLVETEAHLRSCADWVLQFFGEEGVVFTPEMIHLQHLMEKVSKDSAEARTKFRPIRRTSSTVTQTGSSSSAASSVEGHRQSGRRIQNERLENFATGKLRSKALTAKEPRPLQRVEAAGLRVDLVSFDALNNGQPQRNAFLSTSTQWFEWLPAARVFCGGESTSSHFRSTVSAFRRPCDCVPSSGARPDSSSIRQQLDTRASANVAVLTLSETQASFSSSDIKQSIHSSSNLRAGSKSSDDAVRVVSSLRLNECKIQFPSHTFDAVVGRWKGDEHSRLMFGRCHVVEVSLVVAADAARQFDKQLKAVQPGNRQLRTVGLGAGPSSMKSTAGGATGTSEARGNVALKRLQTPVNQTIFEKAAACAASVGEEEDQLSRWHSADKREESDSETNVAVTAGALLRKGSFAGGLVKTASGLHAQGLCVRLVKRLVVVGALPRVMVLQHLAHEFIHAYFACKQKVIDDLPAEEGACNVAAAAVLLRAGAGLKQLLGDSPAFSEGENMSSCYEQSTRLQRPGSFNVSFELLLVRYRLWKMVESTDEVYGVGYRRSLETVGVGHLTFGAFVSRLLKMPRR